MSVPNENIGGILSLPNEILLSVLGLFSTESVLKFSATCHRFHNLILRLLLHRLQVASKQKAAGMCISNADECQHRSWSQWTYALPRVWTSNREMVSEAGPGEWMAANTFALSFSLHNVISLVKTSKDRE